MSAALNINPTTTITARTGPSQAGHESRGDRSAFEDALQRSDRNAERRADAVEARDRREASRDAGQDQNTTEVSSGEQPQPSRSESNAERTSAESPEQSQHLEAQDGQQQAIGHAPGEQQVAAPPSVQDKQAETPAPAQRDAATTVGKATTLPATTSAGTQTVGGGGAGLQVGSGGQQAASGSAANAGTTIVSPSEVAPTLVNSNSGQAATTEGTGNAAKSGDQTPLFREAGSTTQEVNVGRATRGLRAAVNQRGGAVTLRLHPPEMGFLRIEMQMKDGVVRAQLTTQSDAARAMLQQDVAQLRDALHHQGLSVDRLDVQTLDDASSSRGARQESQQSAQDGRSRGRMDEQATRGDEAATDDEPAFDETLSSAIE